MKKRLITSALPYVNNVPHLGNISGSLLPADVYSRYCRKKGLETLFICGTDEFGTATEMKALEMNVTAQELCDHFHQKHKEIYDWFDLSFDFFGRTSEQHEIVQDIFKDAVSHDNVFSNSMEQLYCEKDQMHLADRYVKGECKYCGYEHSNGDQCDSCGRLISPSELINPVCGHCGTVPQRVNSNHLFFMPNEKTKKELEKWFEKVSSTWNTIAKTETVQWMYDGLLPRCITRDLKWGISVPNTPQFGSEFKDKVFYVWFDAPLGYISMTATYLPDSWKDWWQPDDPEQVRLVQFMGKDNIYFHSVLFPATLLSTQQNWKIADTIRANQYLQYEGKKFSKSQNVGIFGDQAMKSGIPSYIWRYYLINVSSTSHDSNFSKSQFVHKANSELLSNLGNFVNRIFKFIEKNYNSTVPDVLRRETCLEDEINELISRYHHDFENFRMKEALQTCMELSHVGNRFITERKPWDLPEEEAAHVLGFAIQIVGHIESMIEPFLPGLSEEIQKYLNMPSSPLTNEFNAKLIPAGHCLKRNVKPIVRKISLDDFQSIDSFDHDKL